MYYRYIHLMVLVLCFYHDAKEAVGCYLRREPAGVAVIEYAGDDAAHAKAQYSARAA